MPMIANPSVLPVRLVMNGTSKLQPAEQTKGTVINFNGPKLTDLPQAMRCMGWQVAPQLMDKWFAGIPYQLLDADLKIYNRDPRLIPADRVDETIVTLAWAQKFDIYLEARDLLIQKWSSKKTQQAIRNRVKTANLSSTQPLLGSVGMSARDLHAVCQIQLQSFGGLFATIDDMYGALAEASVYMAVVGRVESRLATGYRPPTWYDVFIAEKIGIYLRDIYEFNGFQPLGLWTKEKTLGKAEILGMVLSASGDDLGEVTTESALETVYVCNADFRKWRDTYNQGGDFYIFSDVEWLDPPSGSNTVVLWPSKTQGA